MSKHSKVEGNQFNIQIVHKLSIHFMGHFNKLQIKINLSIYVTCFYITEQISIQIKVDQIK